MAEVIGVASGLLALSLFTLKSSTALHNTISSFHSHNSRVKDLQQELEALTSVLGSLSDTIGSTDIDLSPLDLPLRRCAQACGDFEKELLKCSSRSNGVRTSFRDWAKLQYMGEDIDGFKRLLAGYKMTINIALTHASLSSLTAESLADHRNLIDTAHEDLQAHLKSIDEKLNSMLTRTVTKPTSEEADNADLRGVKTERLSALKCLEICEQLSQHIDQMQLMTDNEDAFTEVATQNTLSRRITREGLEACQDNLSHTAARLEKHMKDITTRIVQQAKTGTTSRDDVADLERLQDEWDATRESVKLCSMAGSYLRHNVSSIENHGVGDSVQFMVSTNGQVIHGKNRGMGWKNRQVGGHMSDAVVLQLSRDMVKDNRSAGELEELALRNKAPSATDSILEGARDAPFEGRHGRGFKLEPQSFPNTVKSTTANENACSRLSKS